MADTEASGRRNAGRHGGGTPGEGGLSVADLIARQRAAAAESADRPPRRARRGEEPATIALAEVPAEPARAGGEPAPAGSTAVVGQLPVPPSTRHLTVVGTSQPAPGPVDVAPAAKQHRGGRNLPAAIGVGVALGALIVASLTAYRPSFVLIILAAVSIAVYELVTAIGTVEARPSLVPLLAGGAAMEGAAWYRGTDGLVGALLLTMLGLLIWRLAEGSAGYLPDVGAGALVALYVPFLAGFATLMAHADDGTARIILFILVVVCSDTGGYAVGVLIGKHPMAPTVSPKKSWEGLAGSLVAGSIGGLLMMTLCFHHAWWQGVLFGIALVVTATLGDLGESMIKRDLGLKDMGRLLPGHGGIMDRLDSLLPCAPVAYLLLAAFLR